MRKLLVLGILILLVACTPPRPAGPGGPQNNDYFVGADGVSMRWTDGDSPPGKLFYYSDTEDNTFDISVELANTGASFTRGGVYLSGYDPTLIHVLGINPQLSLKTCGFSLGNIGFGEYGFEIGCDAGHLQLDSNFDIASVGLNLGRILASFGWDKVPLLGNANFEFDQTGDNTKIKAHLAPGAIIDLEYGSRGRLMISVFAGIDFARNFGIEYLMAGDTPEFPGGDIAIVDWDANIINFPPGLETTEQSFLVTNCYLYTTHAAPVMCIDPNPFSEGKKVCSPGSFAAGNGQGGPVAVTSVMQENSPRQAIFTITIANIGDGNVWDAGMMEKCSPYQGTRVTSADKNKVWLGQIRVSGDPTWLDCTPDDFVRLDRDTQSGMITCRYDIPFQGLRSAYQTPLIVELWYGYETTIQKNVVIKRAT